MRRHLLRSLVSLGLVLSPLAADACGGCFSMPGPPALAQVVTEHRMALSVSAEETTLWDQFRFSGRPEEFSWILPVRYTDALRVSVGTDAFIAALAGASAPSITAPPYPWPACPYNPPPYCPPPPSATDDRYDYADASVQDALAADSPGAPPQDAPPPVQVLRDEVVGPFEVRVIRGEDPMAIRVWLQEHQYNVPAAIEPVLAHYTGLSMDYLALRLRPAQGVDRIAPIRVTFPGAVPRLPLRMIAAGVGDRVGLRLFVLSAGRMEAANFPNAEFRDDDFIFDWNTRNWNGGLPSDRAFDAVFTQRRAALGARLWLTEVSDDATPAQLLNFTAPFEGAIFDAGLADGGVTQSLPSDDVRVAFAHLGHRARLTRLRADFPGAMLDQDLELAASDLGVRGATYRAGSQINVPPPPTCPDGSRYDPALRSFVGARPWPPCPTYPAAPATHETVVESQASCAAGPTSAPGGRWSLAALVALTAVGRRRRWPVQ